MVDVIEGDNDAAAAARTRRPKDLGVLGDPDPLAL
jgi:hypothetical protein